MYGGVVAIVIIIVRILAAKRRGQRTVFDFAWPAWLAHLLARVLVLMFALATFREHGSPWAVGALVLVAFLHRVTRLLVVPLGVPHVSYWLTRLACFGGGRALAAFDELTARLRRPRSFERGALERLQRDLFVGQTDRQIRGTNAAVRAILDVVEGDLEQARLLFQLTAELKWRLAPRYVRKYCQAWLLAEAARRGAWQEVVRISRRGPLTRRALFFRAAARRLLQDEAAPSRALLAVAWLAAPKRWPTRALYDAARSRAPRLPSLVEGENLVSLRKSTYAALRRAPGAVTRTEIAALAQAWQRVFDAEEHCKAIDARAVELGAEIDAAQVASEFEADVIATLAELWRHSLPPSPRVEDEPTLLIAAKDTIQFELLTEFETMAGQLPTDDDNDGVDFEAHWRVWARLRGVAREFTDLLPERRHLLGDSGCGEILNFGAWLYNGAQARALANDVFCWLLPNFPKGSENRKIVRRNIRISRDA